MSLNRPLRIAMPCAFLLFATSAIRSLWSGEQPQTTITPGNVRQLVKIAAIEKNAAQRIRWNSDGSRLAFVGFEKPVDIRDAKSLRLVDRFGKDKRIISFEFGPKGRFIAYCESTRVVELLDTQTGVTRKLNASNHQPEPAFSPDGKLIAAGGYGTDVRLWSTKDGKLMSTFTTGTKAGGLRPVFSPDGTLLAVGNRNSTTCVFSISTGKLIHRLPKRMTQELRFDATQDRLAAVYVDGSVTIWSMANGKVIHDRPTDAGELYTLDWSPDDRLLVTAGRNAGITIWDAESMKALRTLDRQAFVIQAKFSPDGGRLFCASGNQGAPFDRKVTVWEVGRGPVTAFVKVVPHCSYQTPRRFCRRRIRR